MVRSVLACLCLGLFVSCVNECKTLGSSWCNGPHEHARCASPQKFEIGNQEVTKDCRIWGAVCTAGADLAGTGAECAMPSERCPVEGARECRGSVHVTCQHGYWAVSPCMGCFVDPVTGPQCR